MTSTSRTVFRHSRVTQTYVETVVPPLPQRMLWELIMPMVMYANREPLSGLSCLPSKNRLTTDSIYRTVYSVYNPCQTENTNTPCHYKLFLSLSGCFEYIWIGDGTKLHGARLSRIIKCGLITAFNTKQMEFLCILQVYTQTTHYSVK